MQERRNTGTICSFSALGDEYRGQFISARPRAIDPPIVPPVVRSTDDTGGGGDAEWMDIYMHNGTCFGVDPRVVNAFGGRTWREIMGGSHQYPEDPVRVYK